jgi:hypothetical protein
MYNADDKEKNKRIGLKVNVTLTDLKGQEAGTSPVSKEAELKAKVSSHFLNSYFTTNDTLKNYNGQIQFNFKAEGDITDITKAKDTLAVIASKGFKGLDLSYQENRVIKGLFNLLQKQNASEQRPFIVLDSVSQLYNEILEKKVKKKKGKYSFTDFSGAEIGKVNEAVETLKKNMQQIIIKGQHGIDKKTKKPLYFFYMKEAPLISIEYLKRDITPEQAKGMTEKQLKETGQIKISILPIFLRDYHKYYKLLPKDISREIREKCPDVKRVSEPLVNFIDLLHRQDKTALINGNELRRTRETLIKELKQEEQRKKRGKQYIKDILFSCYDIAKRTGYLDNYLTDERGKTELVDVFYLNIHKYEHLKPKRIKASQEQELEKRLIYDRKG